MLDPYSDVVINQIIDYMEHLKNVQKPNLRFFLNFDAFGGNVPKFDTSFPFRKAFGWWYQAIYWPLQEQSAEALEIIDKLHRETVPNVSKYCYANATDYDLGRKYLKAYYRKNAGQLIKIKRKYDPTNLFHWKQSIPLKK